MKLKILAAAPLLTLCALTSPLAMAVSADLQLSGKIAAGACDISVTNGGVYSYGDIANEALLPGASLELGSKQNTLNITCAAPMYVALEFTDNRPDTIYGGSKPGLSNFRTHVGLGTDTAGGNIGAAAYRAAGYPVVNNSTGRVLEGMHGSSAWTVLSENGWIYLTSIFSFTDSNVATVPTAVSSLSLPLNVQAILAAREDLELSRGIDLDGSVTVELYYL